MTNGCRWFVVAVAAFDLLVASRSATAAPSTHVVRDRAAAACAQRLDSALTELDRVDVRGSDERAMAAAVLRSAGCLERAAGSGAASVVAGARRAAQVRGEQRSVERAAVAAGLRVFAARRTVAATGRGDAAAARAWLTLRERRTATRIAVPSAPAAGAIASLATGRTEPGAASATVREDLLATSTAVVRARLALAERSIDEGFEISAAIAAAQAASTWQLLEPIWRAQHDGSRASMSAAQRLAKHALATPVDVRALRAAITSFDERTRGFAPVATASDDAAASSAAKLARFVQLVPIEYGRGVRGGRVSLELEIQEARSFLRGAFDAWSQLEPVAISRSAGRAAVVAEHLERLDTFITRAESTPGDVASPADVERAAGAVTDRLKQAVPEAWIEQSSEADLELVAAALARVERSAGRGDWSDAERARVEAYGAFEFGPELRLRAIDPSLALTVEGLIWYGADGEDGLASLIAARADERAFAATRAQLDRRLDEVAGKLDESATPGAVRTSSAIIVLREGMEAVLILAALTAGLRGAASRQWRRPILIGGTLALVATAITFVLAQALLDSLARFGEKLEVVVSLVAIGVLLLILNWFVHKAYWTGWMATFQKKKVAIAGTSRDRAAARRVSSIAQLSGLVVLGFTSIYREGFESVLFLQALVLDAGTLPVLEGAALGMLGVTALGLVTIVLQRKLKYRRMLIVTGVLIAVVLAAMVGGTTQSMQAVGWLSVHPIHGLSVPSWMTTWLGVHPTWEAVSGQFASIVFVMGSYVVAEWWQERKRLRVRPAAQTMRPRAAATVR